jgi:hypothetical protein
MENLSLQVLEIGKGGGEGKRKKIDIVPDMKVQGQLACPKGQVEA